MSAVATEDERAGSITQEQFSRVLELREELIRAAVWADRGSASLFFKGLTGSTSVFSFSEIQARAVIAKMQNLRKEQE